VKNKIAASSLFFIYLALLASGLLQAIISGYLDIYMGDLELHFPPDFFRAVIYTFAHRNIPQISIPIKEILTGAIVGLLGMVIGAYFKRAFHINLG